MTYDFFAYMARMKYIKRWSLMHSVVEENIMEHTSGVCFIAHALAVIGNTYFNKNYDIEKVVLYALYHESSEVITGDLPTPIKYFNKEINTAYKDLEKNSCEKLLSTLPKELQDEYRKSLLPDTLSIEYQIVKKADRLSAYVKCVEECKANNLEFKKAKVAIWKDIEKMQEKEVQYFVKNVLPVYSKTLDELE